MRLRIAVCVSVLLCQMFGLEVVLTRPAFASGSGVVISQLQNAGQTKSTDEFVELANTSGADIPVSGWALQYRAASATNGSDCTKGWITKSTVSAGSIPAGGHYLFAATGYLTPDSAFSPGLAAAGTVRLLDASKTPVDALAWGTATCGTGNAAAAPSAGQSLERHPGADGAHGDNAADYFIQANPQPQSTTATFSPAPGAPSASPDPAPVTNTAGLQLSELLIDPAAPQTDAADEFVEIHNTGTDALDIKDYAVKTGTHTYKFPETILETDGYLVVTSGNTNISLSNSGGVANLLNPAGEIIDTAAAWETAVPGASWAFIDDTWLWTLTPTPGAANEYTPVPGTAGSEDAVDYPAAYLNELLPDPVAPLTNANDEFIEIYNPNPDEIDLTGYVLKAGSDLSKKYVIANVTVPAGGLAVLKSSLTRLALSNSGSSVALYTPAGAQLGATVTYGKAGAGDAWALIDGSWQWTGEPTPGAENVLVAPGTAAAVAKAVKAKAAAKPKTTKAKAAAKPKASKSTVKPVLAAATTPGGRWLLIILASLTIAYIIYEFRYDLRNYYYKLRGYPVGRPAPVPVAVGRGSDRADERPRRG